MTAQNTPLVNQKINYFKFECETSKGKSKQKILLALLGVAIGIVNGFFGAGGGMLVVPVLTVVARLEQKVAHATAIAIILPLCFVSTIVYAVSDNFDTAVLAPTVIGVTLGSIVGALLLKKLSNQALTFLFYGVMLLAGVKMTIG